MKRRRSHKKIVQEWNELARTFFIDPNINIMVDLENKTMTTENSYDPSLIVVDDITVSYLDGYQGLDHLPHLDAILDIILNNRARLLSHMLYNLDLEYTKRRDALLVYETEIMAARLTGLEFIMRKETKPRETCDKCGGLTKYQEEEVFCDVCNTMIKEVNDNLRMTVFYNHNVGSDDVDLCSWPCVFTALKKKIWGKKRVHFINLPIICDHRNKTTAADLVDFLDAAKNSLGYFI